MDILAFDGNVRHLKNVIPQTQRQEIMEALKNIQWMQIRWGIREVPLPRLCFPNVETCTSDILRGEPSRTVVHAAGLSGVPALPSSANKTGDGSRIQIHHPNGATT